MWDCYPDDRNFVCRQLEPWMWNPIICCFCCYALCPLDYRRSIVCCIRNSVSFFTWIDIRPSLSAFRYIWQPIDLLRTLVYARLKHLSLSWRLLLISISLWRILTANSFQHLWKAGRIRMFSRFRVILPVILGVISCSKYFLLSVVLSYYLPVVFFNIFRRSEATTKTRGPGVWLVVINTID